MDSWRQVSTGVLIAIFSIIVILGGFKLATAEGHLSSGVAPTSEIQPSATLTTAQAGNNVSSPTPNLSSSTPVPTGIETSTALPTITGMPVNQSLSTTCTPPVGWIPILVGPNDNLASLAWTYRMTESAIKQANCLTSDQLMVGSVIYLIPLSTATSFSATAIPCGAPYNWVDYYVVAGDTLFNIGYRYGVSVPELQRANCLGFSTNIFLGQKLKVPNVATREPLTTATTSAIATSISTETPTSTATMVIVVPTATQALPTFAPSLTPVPSETATQPATPQVIQASATATPFAGVP